MIKTNDMSAPNDRKINRRFADGIPVSLFSREAEFEDRCSLLGASKGPIMNNSFRCRPDIRKRFFSPVTKQQPASIQEKRTDITIFIFEDKSQKESLPEKSGGFLPFWDRGYYGQILSLWV
jgi:hypothetical protein